MRNSSRYESGRTNKRSLWRFVMIFLWVAGVGLGNGPARADQTLSFPEAHYPHGSAGIEWWYYTGILSADTGTQYGYFFTLFKQRCLLHAVFRLMDVKTGSTVRKDMFAAQRIGRPNELNIAPSNPYTGRSTVLQYDDAADLFRFEISDRDFAVDLQLHPEKPYVPHGKSGYIMQSTAGPSAYYSATAMSAEGRLVTGDMTTTVSGGGWMDHQWGNWPFDPAAYRYDWFSCRFDDQTELMLYHFRDPDGNTLEGYQTGTYIGPSGEKQAIDEFTAEPIGHPWPAPGTDQVFPLHWHIVAPSVDLDFAIDTDLEDQYINAFRSDSGYWEGITYVTDTHTNRTGYCYLEMSDRPASPGRYHR